MLRFVPSGRPGAVGSRGTSRWIFNPLLDGFMVPWNAVCAVGTSTAVVKMPNLIVEPLTPRRYTLAGPWTTEISGVPLATPRWLPITDLAGHWSALLACSSAYEHF